MERATLTVGIRKQSGKEAAHKARAANAIPAILYGPEQQPVKLQIEQASLNQSLKAGGGRYTLLTLQVDGEDSQGINGKFAFIKDVQYHPYRTQILHIDLYQVPVGRKIDMIIPLKFVGQPAAMGKDFVFQELIREVTLHSDVNDLPSHVEVLIDGIQVGHQIHVKDLKLPEKVEILNDPNELVAIMTGKTSSLEEKPKAQAEPEAEPAPEVKKDQKKTGK